MPFLAHLLVLLVAAPLADWLRNSRRLSNSNVRKLACGLGKRAQSALHYSNKNNVFVLNFATRFSLIWSFQYGRNTFCMSPGCSARPGVRSAALPSISPASGNPVHICYWNAGVSSARVLRESLGPRAEVCWFVQFNFGFYDICSLEC